MNDSWQLHNSTGVVRRELSEDDARELVAVNHDEGNTDVYASNPATGQRIPQQ